jgi:geranylgeranyl pyrophosphate synthase
MFVLEGKRLRSRLLFASAARDYFFAASPDMVRAAAAIELVHAASLLHDDVVDHCDLRRGKPVFHRIAGVRTATLSGLHLVHLALAIVATLSAHARRRVAAVARHLSRGQFLEILRAHDVTMRSDERIRIMKLKTASVFGLSCELGGAVSGEDPEVWIRRRRAGEAFGMLFQIADDLDDIFAAEQDLGRPGGADLLAGVMSLPITCALETDARPTLLALFADMRNSASPDHVPTCREILRSSGALDRTFTIALSRANAARGHLVVLPSSPGTEWMTSLVEDTLKRCQRSLQ